MPTTRIPRVHVGGRAAALCYAAVTLVACGRVTPSTVTAKPPPGAAKPPAVAAKREAGAGQPAASLETYIATIRRLQMKAPAASRAHALALESQDPELRTLFEELTAHPNSTAHRRIADLYLRHGIRDAAYDHYTRALAFDDRDGAAHDGLARLWRDWGALDLGLSSAVRATHFSPRSAEAFNTLGTLLYGVGRADAAKGAFERALALQPTAAYAYNNLCYLAFLAADAVGATDACRKAVSLSPHMTPARNNLALSLAASGRFDEAAQQFGEARGAAAREFNLGVVLTVSGRFLEAAQRFDAALAARPGWSDAATRADQARRLAAAADGTAQR
jgi:tetratricopeptide (TPR) repeat protein